MSFIPRLVAPSNTNPKYTTLNPFYIGGYPMPNCTTYAWGRAYEILNSRPTLSTGNADAWYNFQDGYQRGTTPKLGAIVCFSGGQHSGNGHVCVVEVMNNNGSIITSNSAYQGTNFYLKTLRPEEGYLPETGYTFQGFIYLPYQEEVTKKMPVWMMTKKI